MGDEAFSPALRPMADVGETGVTLTGPDDDAPEGVESSPAGGEARARLAPLTVWRATAGERFAVHGGVDEVGLDALRVVRSADR
jgi:hypothetical protein